MKKTKCPCCKSIDLSVIAQWSRRVPGFSAYQNCTELKCDSCGADLEYSKMHASALFKRKEL